ncbi:hypothetical protein B0H11DRAFT_1907746 [Mycena galericulata]|nr:hypothetical protein B0H11DRAFT_1907746 [Mycena galericulata]
MKRKMVAAWKTKTPIYDLVKALTWNSSQEMTDAIWARFAWIQIVLVDYQTAGSPAEQFWDYIDLKLSERREEALEVPLANRPAFESHIFEEALKLHLQTCKPQARRKSSKRLPDWQVSVSRAVEEMEAYTQEDLAGEENDGEGDDEQESPIGGDDIDPSLALP